MNDTGPDAKVVEDNPAEARYEIRVGGDLAGYAAYRDVDGARVFTHTRIEDDYEGQGIGSALARAALDDVRTRGMKAVPRCPFVAGYVQRHHEYDDIVV